MSLYHSNPPAEKQNPVTNPAQLSPAPEMPAPAPNLQNRYRYSSSLADPIVIRNAVCEDCGRDIPPSEPIRFETPDDRNEYRIARSGRSSVPINLKTRIVCVPCQGEFRPECGDHSTLCDVCERVMVFSGIAANRRYCSDECRRYRPPPVIRCTICGTPFKSVRRDALTCSPACRQKTYRQRQRQTGAAS